MEQRGGRKTVGISGNATCMAAIFLFALGFPAAGILLESWGPIALISARTGLAVALLLPLWIALEGWQTVRQAPWAKGLTIGAIGFGIGTVLLLVAQSLSDAVTVVLVVAAMPVGAVALEVACDGRKLTRYFLAGVVLVLLGGYLATGTKLTQGSFGLGAALGLLATLIFAWGSRKAVKGLPELSSFGQTTLTLIGAALFCFITFGVFLTLNLPGTTSAPLGLQGWGLLLIYAWGAMAVSQAFWIVGVGKLGIGIASFHLNAAPFYVMLVMLWLGGSWNWQQAIGAAILAVGVVVTQRREAAAEDCVPAE